MAANIVPVVKSIVKPVGEWVVKNEPALLFTGQVGFGLGATVVALKNADKINSTIADAKAMIEKATSEEQKKDIYKLTVKELTKLVLPIILLQAGSIACSARSLKIINAQGKEIKSLTDTLAATNSALVSYQLFKKEAEKELGEKKLEKVNNEVTKDIVEQNPPTKENTYGVDPKVQQSKDGKVNPVVPPMFLYLDGNTPTRYLWSTKSPADIKAWAVQQSAMLYDGDYAMDNPSDALSINAFYDFLSEGIDSCYEIPAYERDKNMYWRAEDAMGRKTSDLVSIDIGYADGPDGQAIHSVHCNFLPFR